ncbi:MAG TPA: zinc ABC transporter substrate-binding protein [Acidimicrobiales bacterium]|nr:zinc ABC transporter substrate-binding protein [Acidimicrobiales bacterium]
MGGGTARVAGLAGLAAVVVAAPLALVAASAPAPAPPRGVVEVVAAENFWGSIAAQVGGRRVRVASIVARPGADPHDYEPTAADARAVAEARLVIVNGLGYDVWASQLVAASGTHPVVLDVGSLLGLRPGANPHRWYDPGDVRRVAAAIATDLSRVDPGAAGAFQEGARRFESVDLRGVDALLAEIRARFAGTPVGASESIFSLLAPALGLRVLTPASFLRAVSEGAEPSPADQATIAAQIARREIAVYVYNTQNEIPVVQRQLDACRRAGIPTVPITETLVPPSATYQAWQARQLRALLAALEAARARSTR